DAARRVAAAALDREVELAGPVEPLVGSHGRGAFTCQVAGDAPEPWDRAVVVRVADPSSAVRERDWHAFLVEGGHPVPAALGALPVDDERTALVLAQGPSLTLMEALGVNPIAIPQLLRSMAEAHAALHRVPVDGAPGGDPAAAPLAQLDRALADPELEATFGAARRRLAENPPAPGRPVVCHGDLQPASMRLEGDDTSTAMLVNWSSARVGDAEDDVALTSLMFWSAPYLAEGMGQRKMMKTVRDMIIDGYRAAYEGAGGTVALDADRLRYWGAVHALVMAVRLAEADRRGGPADAWDPVALVHHPGPYRKDLARRVARLTRG
ncbi:MAG TPA: phosphotransferase, partial [Acidimicrobiales bacterium]|nr:phosphotransferase [Acidimicrobiales bacterium]